MAGLAAAAAAAAFAAASLLPCFPDFDLLPLADSENPDDDADDEGFLSILRRHAAQSTFHTTHKLLDAVSRRPIPIPRLGFTTIRRVPALSSLTDEHTWDTFSTHSTSN